MEHKINFHIRKKDLVLEIGSGNNPQPRSDVLVDRFFTYNKERQNCELVYDRPLLVSQAEKLPFKDKSFDYIICCQVIEHSQNPIKFCQEISRVGKRGIIICPSALREKIFGWPYHHWWITRNKKNNKLFFRPKKFIQTNNHYHELFRKDISFRRLCFENEIKLNIYFYWENNIFLKVFQKTDDLFINKISNMSDQFVKQTTYDYFMDTPFHLKELAMRFKKKCQKILKLTKWSLMKKIDSKINIVKLMKVMVCPNCKNDLIIKEDNLKCRKCREIFPIKNNIPILLAKEEQKRGF